jgi:NADPH-dependent glutamate synthase beta subunit-like oxidoreductase
VAVGHLERFAADYERQAGKIAIPAPAKTRGGPSREEGGVQFKFMTNPVECIGNKEGWVTGVRCQRMDRLARATHEYLSRS